MVTCPGAQGAGGTGGQSPGGALGPGGGFQPRTCGRGLVSWSLLRAVLQAERLAGSASLAGFRHGLCEGEGGSRATVLVWHGLAALIGSVQRARFRPDSSVSGAGAVITRVL